MWTLQVLGPVRLARAGGAQPLRLGRKGEAALVCLSTRRNAGTPRTALIDLLWADRGSELARNALRQCLFQLRRSMGEDNVLLTTGDQLSIDGAQCEVDLWRFLEQAASANPADWLSAAALYGGALAEDLGDLPAFGQWLAAEREAVQAVAHSLLQRLSMRADAAADEGALRLGRLLLTLDPLHEGSYRALMAIYARQGMRAKAMAVWHECRRVLRTEIDAQPSAQTRAAYERISEESALAAVPAARAVQVVRGHAAPMPLTRRREDAQAMARDYMVQGTHHYFLGSDESNAKAREAYSAAARIFPETPEAAICSAWTYFTDFQFGWNGDPGQNFQRCASLAEELLRCQPDHPTAQALWGRVRLWQGDYQAAVDAFEYTVREQPQNAGMLANAADACMRAGKLHRALELVQRAQAVDPENRGVFLTVEGNTLFAMGELDGAAAAFESAWRRNAALCAARSGLATAYAELGRVDEAREFAKGSWSANNRRMSLDFAQSVMPFADPSLRRRWVAAWRLAGVPQHEPRLLPASGVKV